MYLVNVHISRVQLGVFFYSEGRIVQERSFVDQPLGFGAIVMFYFALLQMNPNMKPRAVCRKKLPAAVTVYRIWPHSVLEYVLYCGHIG